MTTNLPAGPASTFGRPKTAPAHRRAPSIRAKLMLLCGIACLALALFTLFVVKVQLNAIERAARLEVSNVARVLTYDIARQPESLQKYIEGLDEMVRRDIVVVNTRRLVLADPLKKAVGELYAGDPDGEVDQTLADARPRFFVAKSGASGVLARQVVMAIHQGNGATSPVLGAVVLEYSRIHDELQAEELPRVYRVAACGLFGILVVAGLCLSLSHSINRRLASIVNAVDHVAAGDFAIRIAVEHPDEIGSIQAAFNTMTEDLMASRKRLLAEVEREKSFARQIEQLAYYDSLTGAPNRGLFSKLLEQALAAARRSKRQLAVIFLDLDRFKIINDTLGHEAGDTLLKEVALRIKACLRSGDTVARLGGDEFVMLLPGYNDEESLAVIAERVLSSLAQPCRLAGQEFRVTASLGISRYPADGEDEASLMKHADIAMYQAKEDGKNTFAFYAEGLNKHSLARLAFESSLRRAMERREFEVHYQPKVDCRSSRMTGVEALLRWNHPDLGLVPPSRFIPVAEDIGLIVPLGKWVLEQACRQQVEWQRRGLPALRVAVNLSARQFDDDRLLEDVASVIAASGIDAACLELELTESMLMRDVPRAAKVLAGFKSLGIGLAVDDFGTGYSSLANLKRFPVDSIKIDRSFVRDLATSADDKAIASAIIAMGKTMGLSIVAEGVETGDQAAFLVQGGCDEIQGFFYSKAIPAEAVVKLIQAHPLAVLSGTDATLTPRGRLVDSAFADSL